MLNADDANAVARLYGGEIGPAFVFQICDLGFAARLDALRNGRQGPWPRARTAQPTHCDNGAAREN